MDIRLIQDYSNRLKDIARDLSFLGHPRYPLKDLLRLFPQHASFISNLEDVSIPFPVNISDKRRAMDVFLNDLAKSDVALPMKRVFTQRVQDYHTLLSMMENFDNVFFYDHCTRLYGTSHHLAHDDNFQTFLEKIH